jgi:hypothetical protein
VSWRASQYPDLRVSIAFDTTDPMTASPTWTLLSSTDVRSVRIRRGRSDETQRFNAGTATVVLDNRTRKFDPTYSAGTYFGKLLPLKQIKVEAVWNSTTYPIFRGLIEGWPQEYHESNRDATVELVANDAFEHLSNFDIPDISGILSQFGTVGFWYPLNDDNTGELYNTAVDLTYGQHGAYAYDDITSFVDFRQPPLVGDGSSVRLSGGAHVKLSSATLPVLLTPQVYTIAGVFSHNGNPAGVACPVIDSTGDYVNASTRVEVYADGTVGFTVAAGVATAGVGSTAVVTDGKPHSFVVTRNGTALQLWIDGVSQGTATMGAAVLGAGTHIQVGNYITKYNGTTGLDTEGIVPFNGNVQHFVAYPTALSATNAAALGGWLVGWANQSSSDRIGKILDLVGWPSALRSIETGQVTVAGANLGSSALSEAQLVEASENGRLFVDRSGNVTFHNRVRDITSAAPTVTFGTADSATSVQVIAGSTSLRYDRDYLINDATVTGPGVSGTASDSTSITSYGRRRQSRQTLLRTANDVRALAELIVLDYKDPKVRADGFTVRPARAPSTAWPIVLGLEIGSKVTLSRTPQALGSAISQTLVIQSVEHNLEPEGDWSVKFTGAPYDTTSYWTLGTSSFDSATKLYA